MWREIRRFRPGELERHDLEYRRWVLRQRSLGRFSAVIVEDDGGRPVGSGALWRMPWIPRPGPLGRGELPYVLSMYTAPRYRGRGVATRIVAALVDRARLDGFARVVLHASRFGRSLYEHLGFEAGSEMRLSIRPARRAPPRGTRR
jgi:GNAT superfamily N-acetyltransferase